MSLSVSSPIYSHILGYPRIGSQRQLKLALERYWQGAMTQTDLLQQAQTIEQDNWQAQVDAGLSLLTVGDFVLYDHILTHAVRLGVLPPRFAAAQHLDVIDRQFYLARGRTEGCPDVAALEMTKWFDTNYHYLVPELQPDQQFNADFSDLLRSVQRAKQLHPTQPLKVVVNGLLSFLYLSRVVVPSGHAAHDSGHALAGSRANSCCVAHSAATAADPQQAAKNDHLALLPRLIPVYQQLFDQLAALGVAYVQVDEPILALDLPTLWQSAFERTYHHLKRQDGLKLIVASYFGGLGAQLNLAVNLPVAGLHVDITRTAQGETCWPQIIDQLPQHKILSLGLVNGRSVWASDLPALAAIVAQAYRKIGSRLWVGSSCSLLHVPVSVAAEQVPVSLQGRLAFARQKLDELAQLATMGVAEQQPVEQPVEQQSVESLQTRALIAPFTLVAQVRPDGFEVRQQAQAARLRLPLFPTTTIGSFPQTAEIRAARAAWLRGDLSDDGYTRAMQNQIGHDIKIQEQLGLDVLVHGEAERTDMVEYFAGLLEGFWLSRNGWVQSYGSRCVRPPIIVGDIVRTQPMTVAWTAYASQLTTKPVKGMLTGPVTLLNWSFPPAQRSRREVALQLAEAIRQEVADLQAAGVAIIQIDEAAFREGLPLRQAERADYWDWAVSAFKHCASSAQADTQIHTHMCYSTFHDCLPQITAMDADVITIETSRSGLQLLDAFAEQGYPNALGPGVYDIHSPRTPKAESMMQVIELAKQSIDASRLWVNPDCGLKTRQWPETLAALTQMVEAARRLREQHAQQHRLVEHHLVEHRLLADDISV